MPMTPPDPDRRPASWRLWWTWPLALLILFEEWGWKPLAAILSRLARWRPWSRLEHHIRRLPGWASLAVLLVPALTLLPLKILGLWWMHRGHVLSAVLGLLVVKVVGTAIVAWLFQLVQPRLMQWPWFARLHQGWTGWKARVLAPLLASEAWQGCQALAGRMRRQAKRVWRRWRVSAARR